MNKTKKSYLSKALIFGFISTLVLAYIPNVSFDQIKVLTQAGKYTNEFNQVQAVYHFTKGSDINTVLQSAADHLKTNNPKSEIRVDDPHVLFSIWVLRHKNIAMKDLDWLWYEAPLEIHYYWQSNRPDPLVNMEYVIFGNVGYMGIFNRENEASPYYLQTIYEFDRLKQNNPLIP
ncbi:hypothetical protein [Paenibacillus mendelii]|uniref:Uncharacterized protein n=1 Tax=Paenibacillus mendelii TaxID=206163 RepID=A0ABV6J2H0_9BACL|nr:hypothetical protein [Paenibacillus mendelii]MCQ6563274.1 hypothetical protein [Paenibacillus mendelii]